MSADLFDWKSPSVWIPEVEKYAQGILTSQVRAEVARTRPECWSDNFAWLPVEGGDRQFVAAFAAYYSRIRAFHGCRPVDLRSYFRHGLCGQSAVYIEKEFRRIFADIPDETLSRSITEFQDRKESEADRFWVLLDLGELVEQCGHYLIQGSEYLMSLAASLGRSVSGEDYRCRLRVIGTPTVFELGIPTRRFDEPNIAALSRLVLSSWGQRIARRPLGLNHGTTLAVRGTLEPKYFLGHSHPERISDPHFGRTDFLNEKSACPYCAG